MDLTKVIKKPLITEKTLSLANMGKYTFVVDKTASFGQVKKAVEDYFKVKVTKLWFLKNAGKLKRVGKLKRNIKKISGIRKAIVKLAKDQKIDLFETSKK